MANPTVDMMPFLELKKIIQENGSNEAIGNFNFKVDYQWADIADNCFVKVRQFFVDESILLAPNSYFFDLSFVIDRLFVDQTTTPIMINLLRIKANVYKFVDKNCPNGYIIFEENMIPSVIKIVGFSDNVRLKGN